MKKIKLDDIVLRRALQILLDIDGAVNVNIGEHSFLLYCTEKGTIIKPLDEKVKEGYVLIESPKEYKQPYSEYDH